MIYTMLILTAFLFFLFIRNIRNIYAWIFILMIIGLVLCIFSILIFVNKTSSYNINSFFLFDQRLFLLISTLRINYYWIFRILNIGIALYLISVPLFIFRYTKQHYYLNNLNHILKTTIAFIPPLFFIFYYDPLTSYHFYLTFHKGTDSFKSFLTLLLTIIDIINYVWIITFLVYPVVILTRNYIKSRAMFFKKRNLTFIICFVLMNTFFFTMFFTEPFRGLSIYSSNLDASFVKHIIAMKTPSYYYNIMPLIMLTGLTVMGFMLMKNRGLGTIDIFRRFFVEKNIIELNRYFRGFLHGFKNTFFQIKILADKAEDIVSAQAADPVKKINSIATDTISSISRTLNSVKEFNIAPKRNNLRECMDEALSEAALDPRKIRVTKLYDSLEQTNAFFDFYLMKSAFFNIIQNAAESIYAKNTDGGEIIVDISSESRVVVVSITDNGTGIAKRNMRKIFKMFFTTKTRQRNWGAGLSFVSNIVQKHLGIINVYSTVGEYAKFEIVLSKAWEEKIPG